MPEARPHRPPDRPASRQSGSRAQVWPLLGEGRCLPILHSTFPLAQASQAHQLMESSKHIGKIILEIAP
ncbi:MULTISPECIES: zinc-binding dehydrogenase [Pseudomonas]|uniref:Zinc-binding dehydrogenase n=1 Tax=Pseudomonas juntendi TaxID=2666183 RepID=A0A7W2M0Z1_9PSED|nr:MULTISPECIES: zinc-binding dehydrogenase [Pseudomonas]MBA6133716.1 zinc-binding dehydrogenase [Pseudomonas juntendi]MBA6150705.1 zinc-binding dehydrogenase [Pseudomonas juntendi]MCK2113380.1 zinc-binding dehydrogenase [Pseudomonas juntendi]MCK2118661.1 zinc-binding dehydrogenase [Pseudomonas juntendi]MDG9811271.1 zinc-binding dehydrogenase [Pseudomonas juntendi]